MPADAPVAATAPDAPAARRIERRSLASHVAGWLPLVLLALLAIGTWQLARHGDSGSDAAPPRPLAADKPDYTMRTFAATRFDATGRQTSHLEGDTMRHYPQPERFEVDEARMQARSEGGRRVEAVGRIARATDAGRIVELQGGAQLRAPMADGRLVVVASDHLQVDGNLQRLTSDRPVEVTDGRSRLLASGMRYEHGSQKLELSGPVRARFVPGAPLQQPPSASTAASASSGAAPAPSASIGTLPAAPPSGAREAAR